MEPSRENIKKLMEFLNQNGKQDFASMVGELEEENARFRTVLRNDLYVGLPSRHSKFEIAHDGFHGKVIGHYVRLDGKRGVVGQFAGTNMVHVYGEKWLDLHGGVPGNKPGG